MPVINNKKKAKNFEKKANQNKKILVSRFHDNIKSIPDFATRPKNHPSFPNICELDQLLSEILHIFIKKQ